MSMESGIRRYADVFAASFRDAINARGLTLARLHEQLRARGNSVSMATLSYWRSGARRPEGAQSMAALTDIEQLLHLEPGSLTALLGTTNRTGPLGPNLFPLDEHELEEAVKDAFAALGAEYPDTSRELTTHSVTDVDAAGNVAYSITRSIVQSTVGTVSSIPFLEMTPGISTPAPFIDAVAGGRISARYSHPNGEVHGVLFELDVPLTAPSTAMVEWSVAYPRRRSAVPGAAGVDAIPPRRPARSPRRTRRDTRRVEDGRAVARGSELRAPGAAGLRPRSARRLVELRRRTLRATDAEGDRR
jgi:hypothetical protein